MLILLLLSALYNKIREILETVCCNGQNNSKFLSEFLLNSRNILRLKVFKNFEYNELET